MSGQVEFGCMVFQVGDYFWGQRPEAKGIWCRCATDEFSDSRPTIVAVISEDLSVPLYEELPCFYWMYCGPLVSRKECKAKAPELEVGSICGIRGVPGEWKYLGSMKATRMDITQHFFANTESGKASYWDLNVVIVKSSPQS